MKNIYLTLPILLLSFFIYGQNDTVYFSKEKLDTKIESLIEKLAESLERKQLISNDKVFQIESNFLDSLKITNQRLNKIDSTIISNYQISKNTLSELNSERLSFKEFKRQISEKILKLEMLITNEVNLISSNQLQLKDSLDFLKTDTTNKLSSLDSTVDSNANLGYLLILGCIILAISLFYFIRKKLYDSTTKLDNEIEVTRTKFHAEQMKLDQKLIELMDTIQQNKGKEK